MDRRRFLLLAAAATAAGCGRLTAPGSGLDAEDADRIRGQAETRARYRRDRARDWVPPDAVRTVPPRTRDATEIFPELTGLDRKAVLLHPRYSDEPARDESKMGGTFLWPEDKPWPTCEEHHIPYVPVLQLRAEDFPEVEFRPGADLMQLLWCPRDHEMWMRPALFWRSRAAVLRLREAMPSAERAYPGYVPLPCRLFPERVTEYPSHNELPPGLARKLEEWDRRGGKMPGIYKLYLEALSTYLGCKAGGYADWPMGDETPSCRGCGRRMDLLLTLGNSEGHWKEAVPVQEWPLHADRRKNERAIENAANAPGFQFIGEGNFFLFICRRCPDWPVRHVTQCL
jgi:hypothetical protein